MARSCKHHTPNVSISMASPSHPFALESSWPCSAWAQLLCAAQQHAWDPTCSYAALHHTGIPTLCPCSYFSTPLSLPSKDWLLFSPCTLPLQLFILKKLSYSVTLHAQLCWSTFVICSSQHFPLTLNWEKQKTKNSLVSIFREYNYDFLANVLQKHEQICISPKIDVCKNEDFWFYFTFLRHF